MSILDSILRVVDARLARLDTHALYEGTVVQQTSDGLLEVELDDDRFGPGITHLSIAFGIPGVTVEVAKNARVAVGFHDGRRDKPIVRHWLSGTPVTLKIEASDNVTITSTASVDLGEAPRLGVARMTDAVQAGPFSGAIVGGSARVKAGL